MAVDEATAELARALARERDALRRADAQEAAIRREQAEAGGHDAAAFAEWLPHARDRLASLRATVRGEQERVRRCQAVLTERRTAAEAVAKALERQRTAAALVAARREQAVMDEAAGRRHGNRAIGKM